MRSRAIFARARSQLAVVFVAAVTVTTAGCFNPSFQNEILCDHGQCQDGMACIANHCEPPGTPPMLDAGASDAAAPSDARTCFGAVPFGICLRSAPSGPLPVGSTTLFIDTTTSKLCDYSTSIGDGYCVVAATEISLNIRLRGFGSKPLVLIASDAIEITNGGSIDVGSHHGSDPGAGADPAGMCDGMAPGVQAGGAGGSFSGKGGPGGAAAGGGVGGKPAAAISVATLHGGCPGQDGNGGASGSGTGGHGGGAVYVLAGNRITIAGGGVNASGAGGGAAVHASSASGGGGGGGAGGMIILDAPSVTNMSLVLANGGGGGEGSGEMTDGAPGADPVDTSAAFGGNGNGIGGDGGRGSTVAANSAGGSGGAGQIQAPDLEGGGGGGGGGAGYIIVRSADNVSLGTNVSPIPTTIQ